MHWLSNTCLTLDVEVILEQVASDIMTPKDVTVKSFADMLEMYECHLEAKSLGPDSALYHRQTVGLLGRR